MKLFEAGKISTIFKIVSKQNEIHESKLEASNIYPIIIKGANKDWLRT